MHTILLFHYWIFVSFAQIDFLLSPKLHQSLRISSRGFKLATKGCSRVFEEYYTLLTLNYQLFSAIF